MSRSTPLKGLRQIAGDYDAFVVDLWGVMHDGVTAFPDSLACLEELRALGKKIVILSNAPRRSEQVIARNAEMGIRPDLAHAVLSSGEETWQFLATRGDAWYAALGEACYHLGPARDLGMREGLDYRFVEEIPAADFVLLTGTLDPRDVIGDYEARLQAMLAAGVPMICANPDLVVIRGGLFELCAGSVAQRYEALGGEVRYHGKPHAETYRRALGLLDLPAGAKVAALGDSLRTDIAGAQGVGIDAVFIADGIHRRELGLADEDPPEAAEALGEAALEGLFAAAGRHPEAWLPRLLW